MFKLNNRCCSTSELPLVQCRKKSYKIITWQLKKDHIKSGCTKTNLCFIITVHKYMFVGNQYWFFYSFFTLIIHRHTT